MSETDRVINPSELSGDKAFDLSLRPKTFNEYIGQENIKANLEITIKATVIKTVWCL